MATLPRQPVLQALLVAEHVYKDVQGKYIICGTFNGFYFGPTTEEVLPEGQVRKAVEHPQQIRGVHQSGSPWIYVSLVEIHESAKLELRYVSLKDEKVYFKAILEVKCNDPLATVETAFPAPQIPKVAGLFAFELVHNNELLGSHRVTVTEGE